MSGCAERMSGIRASIPCLSHSIESVEKMCRSLNSRREAIDLFNCHLICRSVRLDGFIMYKRTATLGQV